MIINIFIAAKSTLLLSAGFVVDGTYDRAVFSPQPKEIPVSYRTRVIPFMGQKGWGENFLCTTLVLRDHSRYQHGQ